MGYSLPGKLNEVDAAALEAWNEYLSLRFDEEVANARAETRPASARAWFFNPIAEPSGDAEKSIAWTAFPKEVSDMAPTPRKAWEFADASRDVQSEYCEWEVARDNGGRVVRATFTSEPFEYYDFLFRNAEEVLLGLYRRFVSPSVRLADLDDGQGGYDPRNKWNLPRNARGALMHMAQGNNSLQAAMNLAAVASWPRKTQTGAPITDEQQLIACRRFGVAGRHSDPHIGAQVNALVRAGNEVSLADPVGLYIDSVDMSDWETPDGSDVRSLLRITRGSEEFKMRVVFEAPKNAGFALGDVRIGGELIQFGGQIADKVRVRLRGRARPAPAPAPALTCGGVALASEGLEPFAATSGYSRVSAPESVLSPE